MLALLTMSLALAGGVDPAAKVAPCPCTACACAAGKACACRTCGCPDCPGKSVLYPNGYWYKPGKNPDKYVWDAAKNGPWHKDLPAVKAPVRPYPVAPYFPPNVSAGQAFRFLPAGGCPNGKCQQAR